MWAPEWTKDFPSLVDNERGYGTPMAVANHKMRVDHLGMKCPRGQERTLGNGMGIGLGGSKNTRREQGTPEKAGQLGGRRAPRKKMGTLEEAGHPGGGRVP